MKEELKETEKKEEDELESLFNTFDEKYKNFEEKYLIIEKDIDSLRKESVGKERRRRNRIFV
jgi:hypothetical protein